jgi:hypothetical protein
VDRPEEGYFLGALMLNLVAAELLLAAGALVLVVSTWPDVPWTGVMYGGAVVMVAAPLLLYPFTKLIWLAVDLRLQPDVSSTPPAPGPRLPS